MKHALRLALLVAVAAGLPACAGDDPPAETRSQALERLAPSRPAPSLTATTPPASYEVTLERVTATSDRDEGVLRAERVVRTVTRPFVSVIKDSISRRFGFEQDSPTSVERAVFLRPLPDEPRPDAFTPDLSHATNRGRRLAGRDCRVYRYDKDEYCIDAAGLVLASRVGSTVEVAKKVTVKSDTAPSAADIAATVGAGISDKSKGSVRRLEPTSSPPGRTDWSLAAPPEGFTLVGRYAVVPLTGELLTQGSTAIIAGVTDVYVRGIDVIVVDRGGRLNLSAVQDRDIGGLDDTTDVDLGQLGPGRVGIGGIGPFGYREVRASNEKGRYVVVAGTVPAEQLVEIARALRPSPGTELRYLETP